MAGLLDVARGILGLVSPTTGTHAVGKASFSPALSGSPLVIVRNSWVAPVINGALRPDLVCRVLPNPATTDGHWALSGSATLDVESLAGGTKQNLPAGTVLQWLDGVVPNGLDPLANPLVVTNANPLIGGTNVPTWGTDFVKYVGVYESIGPSITDLELFSSSIGEVPAMVLVWDGTEGADGLTMSSMTKGNARVRRGEMAYKEQWSLLIISDRQDSDNRRRAEGLRLVDSATNLLFDQVRYGGDKDGVRVSGIDGVQIRSRFRLSGRTPFYQKFYVYGLRLATTRIYEKLETRTFNPWTKTKIGATNPDTNLPTDANPLPLVTGALVTMPQT